PRRQLPAPPSLLRGPSVLVPTEPRQRSSRRPESKSVELGACSRTESRRRIGSRCAGGLRNSWPRGDAGCAASRRRIGRRVRGPFHAAALFEGAPTPRVRIAILKEAPASPHSSYMDLQKLGRFIRLLASPGIAAAVTTLRPRWRSVFLLMIVAANLHA